MQAGENLIAAGTEVSAFSGLLTEPAGSANRLENTDAESRPPISRDVLSKLALRPFIPMEFAEIDPNKPWPSRDPFSTQKPFRKPRITAEEPHVTETLIPAPPPEPTCVFSGTLMEQEQRLALVDGEPLSLGARLGRWRLVRIEPEYIILEAGKETRRIELLSMEFHASCAKNPS